MDGSGSDPMRITTSRRRTIATQATKITSRAIAQPGRPFRAGRAGGGGGQPAGGYSGGGDPGA
jgi:hypothetical protein